MGLKILALFIAILASSTVWAEDNTSPLDLRYEKSFWGTKYFNGEDRLREYELENYLSSNAEALNTFYKSEIPGVISTVMAYIGGAAIGFALANAADPDREQKSGFLTTGLVALGVGVVAAKRSDKHQQDSIDVFNASTNAFNLNPPSSNGQATKVKIFPNGIGFSLTF